MHVNTTFRNSRQFFTPRFCSRCLNASLCSYIVRLSAKKSAVELVESSPATGDWFLQELYALIKQFSKTLHGINKGRRYSERRATKHLSIDSILQEILFYVPRKKYNCKSFHALRFKCEFVAG